MSVDLDPRRALSGGPQRISLIRCRGCKRTEECSPASVMWLMQDGGMRCCGEMMELFIQTTWPGQGSGVVKTPTSRVIPTAVPTTPLNETIAW